MHNKKIINSKNVNNSNIKELIINKLCKIDSYLYIVNELYFFAFV